MVATIINGSAIARDIRRHVADRVQRFRLNSGRAPGLATILVGDDPASQVYVDNKRRLATECGFGDQHRWLPSNSTRGDIERVIDELAESLEVDGILLQLPVPSVRDSAALIDRIPADKDVDGLGSVNAGRLARHVPGLRPCTPTGVMRLLDTTRITLRGKVAAVVGTSALVGRPMAQMLLERDATVLMAHEYTADLAALTRSADVVITATGVRGLITAEHIRPGATVIDVGITRTANGVVGDVDFERVRQVAGAITPVPGGVGPMTVAVLLSNTITAAEQSVQLTSPSGHRTTAHSA